MQFSFKFNELLRQLAYVSVFVINH